MKKHILCIEDDDTIQTLVEVSLTDYLVHKAKSLKEAEKELSQYSFSALIMDIELPDGDGLRFLSQIMQQEKYKKIPVLVLSHHVEISNKVMAFSVGAEDFIGKPFDPIELNIRLTAKIKRRDAEQDEQKIRKIADVLLDFDRQKSFQVVGFKEVDLNLTSIELKIFSTLTKRLEQVYSRDQLMNLVWGETFISDRTVDSHIAHLRQKIEPTAIAIETSKNFGYRAAMKTNMKNKK